MRKCYVWIAFQMLVGLAFLVVVSICIGVALR